MMGRRQGRRLRGRTSRNRWAAARPCSSGRGRWAPRAEASRMAITNRDRVGRAMDQLAQGLALFVEREMDARAGKDWRKWVDYERDRKLPRNRVVTQFAAT